MVDISVCCRRCVCVLLNLSAGSTNLLRVFCVYAYSLAHRTLPSAKKGAAPLDSNDLDELENELTLDAIIGITVSLHKTVSATEREGGIEMYVCMSHVFVSDGPVIISFCYVYRIH